MNMAMLSRFYHVSDYIKVDNIGIEAASFAGVATPRQFQDLGMTAEELSAGTQRSWRRSSLRVCARLWIGGRRRSSR